MNSKGHLFISLGKSIIRIVSCITVLAFLQPNIELSIVCYGFLFSECLGILEEVFDGRG